jgi:Uma2 family endonuclease
MSPTLATQVQYTPEDLLAMPDGKSYELVGGQLEERNMGAQSSWVGGEVHFALRMHCGQGRAGWALPADSGYQCFSHDRDLVRKPDVSFIRLGRLAGETLPTGWIRIAPDLAVEVVSPKDTVYKLDEKIQDYQKAGVPLIWVIYPNSRTVRVYRINGTESLLHEHEDLSGEEIIPGFRCSVAGIFPPRDPSPEVAPSPAGPNGHG